MTPKQEAEDLMNEMLPVAKRMLREHGEFFPYGGYMKHFALEHQNGEALDVFLPYNLDSSHEVACGEMFATHRTKQFFANKP